jgi:1,4-dihydroxy-2-naphthoyl-CoA hydrolase
LALQMTGFEVEVSALGEGEARGRVAIRDELQPPTGAVYAALAESLASHATPGFARPLSVHTTVTRAVRDGAIEGIARCRHRGRTTWVWEVEMTGAVARVTVAVDPPPSGEHRPMG